MDASSIASQDASQLRCGKVDQIEQCRPKQSTAGQSRAGQGSQKYSKEGQGRAAKSTARKGRAGQAKEQQGRAGQDRAGQGRAGKRTATKGRARQDRAGQPKEKQGRAGKGRTGKGRAEKGTNGVRLGREGQGAARQMAADAVPISEQQHIIKNGIDFWWGLQEADHRGQAHHVGGVGQELGHAVGSGTV